MSTVRHSRQIVAFDAGGRGWDVRASVDENSPPPHVSPTAWFTEGVTAPRPRRVWAAAPPPEPVRSVSPPIPARDQMKRTVLVPISNVNELILKKEIGALESELARAKRAFLIQEKVVDGFCKMRMRG